jgi:hypothetical protein
MHKEELIYKNSRIKIITDKKKLVKAAYDELINQRTVIEDFIKKNKVFESSMEPLSVASDAPLIVKLMSDAGKKANVGPMAAVAGIISEFICRKIIEKGAKVAVVENGGDIFAITDKPISVGLYVDKEELSGKLAFRLDKENTPIAICSSSSFMGHSLSTGKCDLATVFSKKGNVADAAATALANMIKEEDDMNDALKWVIGIDGVDGALAIKNDKIGAIGEIPPMIKSDDKNIKEKVTKDESYHL